MTPRIAETAKALWYIYLLLTISCATAYWLAGMSISMRFAIHFQLSLLAVFRPTMLAWGISIVQ